MGVIARNFFITFFVFLIIDMLWLGLIAKKMYSKYLGYIMTNQVNWLAAIIFYVLFIVGLLYFVINPATSLKTAFFAGALFGLITYATYDLTNLATLKDWPLKITIIDLVWGTFLAASTASFSYMIIEKLNK